MMDKHNGPEHAGDGRIRFLRCMKCSTEVGCSPVDLLTYMRTGWPKCCQETMVLFIEPKFPDGANS
jgi:hypothetical protein